MKQLTIGDIENFILQLKKQNKKYKDIVVYLGNDDELNGVHCAWCCELLEECDKDTEEIIALINDGAGNNALDKIAILLS